MLAQRVKTPEGKMDGLRDVCSEGKEGKGVSFVI